MPPSTPAAFLSPLGQPSALTAALAKPLHAAATQVAEGLPGFAYLPALTPVPPRRDRRAAASPRPSARLDGRQVAS